MKAWCGSCQTHVEVAVATSKCPRCQHLLESTEVFADVNPADFKPIERDLAHLDPARYRLTPSPIEYDEPVEKLVERLRELAKARDLCRQQDTSKVGFVYVLINQRFPDLVKIGQTNSSSSERANELSKPTGVPAKFVVAYEIKVADCVLAESLIHKELREYRVSRNREFFAISTRRAIETIMKVVAEHALAFIEKSQ